MQSSRKRPIVDRTNDLPNGDTIKKIKSNNKKNDYHMVPAVVEKYSTNYRTVDDTHVIQNLLASGNVPHVSLGDKLVEVVSNPNSLYSVTVNMSKQEEDQSADHKYIAAGNVIMALVPVAVTHLSGVTTSREFSLDEMPLWMHQLRDCQKIGDFYRGWVQSESDLELLLALHKQQTRSTWGTRQSSAPGKSSTRLMWKSQYVPFDGIPFLNSGSRATVMECQYGPRKMGGSKHTHSGPYQLTETYKQTCSARVYIKKVKKFPSFAIEIVADKKLLKASMDAAFKKMKQIPNLEDQGEERIYVQLPTETAHCYHDEFGQSTLVDEEQEGVAGACEGHEAMEGNSEQLVEEAETQPSDRQSKISEGLHPMVSGRLQELVAAGHTDAFTIRKMLRRYVQKDLILTLDAVPEKHNLSFYPTINEIYNHIHQTLQDIGCARSLPFRDSEVTENNKHVVCVELVPPEEQEALQDLDEPVPITVTLVLKSSANGESHIISRVETQMSDGSLHVSNSLSPEIAHLISQLSPDSLATCSASDSLPDASAMAESSVETQQKCDTLPKGAAVSITLHESMMVNPNVAAGTQEEESHGAPHLSSAESALATETSLAGHGHRLWSAATSGMPSLCPLDDGLTDLSGNVVEVSGDYDLDDVHAETTLVIDDSDTQNSVTELGLCSQR